MTNPYEWLRMIGANESLREIAAKTGVSHATLSRQINDGGFLMDTTIRLARAYGVSPVAALVANGHLTDIEAGLNAVDSALELATDAQLVAAVAARLGVDLSIFDKPMTEAFAEAKIHQFPTPSVPGFDEDLDEVAGHSDIPHEEDTDDYIP